MNLEIKTSNREKKTSYAISCLMLIHFNLGQFFYMLHDLYLKKDILVQRTTGRSCTYTAF